MLKAVLRTYVRNSPMIRPKYTAVIVSSRLRPAMTSSAMTAAASRTMPPKTSQGSRSGSRGSRSDLGELRTDARGHQQEDAAEDHQAIRLAMRAMRSSESPADRSNVRSQRQGAPSSILNSSIPNGESNPNPAARSPRVEFFEGETVGHAGQIVRRCPRQPLAGRNRRKLGRQPLGVRQ